MSSEAIAWVVRDGMRNLPTRLVPILVLLADESDRYGEGAHPWIPDRRVGGDLRPGLATLCGVSTRLVRGRLAELEDRGTIRLGNQRLVEHIPINRRPSVWDIPGVRDAYVTRSSGLIH